LANEEGNLEAPTRLEEVLQSFDQRDYFLMQVQPAQGDQLPVCKIFNKKEARAAEKAKAKASRATKVIVKSIELNWAIDANDLSHRLKQLTTFLDKGRRVEVLLTSKRHKRRATVDEIKHVMQRVLDTVREAGAHQTKAMEGEPGKQVTFTVQKDN
jgi:translation initiation factor IF-3